MNAPCTAQREAGTALVLEGGPLPGTRPTGAISGALLRVLAVVVLALTGLLFGLLPGGRDAFAVTPAPGPLPAAPAVHYLHPHGPNRTPHHHREPAGR